MHRFVLIFQGLGETKVNHFNTRKISLLRKHEVFGFDITVRNALVMKVLKCQEKLIHNIRSLVFTKEFVLNDILEELTSFAVLENQEADVHPVPDLVQFDDVRMVKVLQDLDFVHESLQIFEVILLNRLDSELLLCFTILS